MAGSGGGQAAIALAFQGGGAFGAWQAGAYEAFASSGLEVDVVAGISIGAVNAAIVAGNPPERRVERLRAFWTGVASPVLGEPLFRTGPPRTAYNEASAALCVAMGVPGFYRPRFASPLPWTAGTRDGDSLHDMDPLRDTLLRLVDFDYLRKSPPRLLVGAVDARDGSLLTFDSARGPIRPEHVMASGAVPPHFPPVEVDGVPCWDAAVVDNNPLRLLLEAVPAQELLALSLEVFAASGALPTSVAEAGEREKELRHAARVDLDLALLLEVRRLRGEPAPEIVRLAYAGKNDRAIARDSDFSRRSIEDHWQAGHGAMRRWLDARIEAPRGAVTGSAASGSDRA